MHSLKKIIITILITSVLILSGCLNIEAPTTALPSTKAHPITQFATQPLIATSSSLDKSVFESTTLPTSSPNQPKENRPTATPIKFTERVRIEPIDIIGGKPAAIAVAGDHVFMAVNKRLVVIDASQPQQLRKIGKSDPAPVKCKALVVKGKYIYWLGEDRRLLVYNIASIDQPHLEMSIDLAYQGNSITVYGDNLLIGTGDWDTQTNDNRLLVVDITNPNLFNVIGELQTDYPVEQIQIVGQTVWVKIVLRGKEYGEFQNSEVVQIDLGNPRAPKILAKIKMEKGYVLLSYPYALKIENQPFVNNDVQIIDLSKSETHLPTTVITLDGLDIASEVIATAQDNQLWITRNGGWGDTYIGGTAQIQSIDLTDFTKPKVAPVKNSIDGLEIEDVKAVDQRLYVLEYDRLAIFDTSHAQSLRLLGHYISFSPTMRTSSMALQDHILYVGNNTNLESLFIFDLSNPADPIQLGPFLPSGVRFVFPDQDLIYLQLSDLHFSVVDVSDYSAPKLLSTVENELVSIYAPQQLPAVLWKKNMYIGSANGGFQVMDISKSVSPTFISNVQGELIDWMMVQNDKLYTLSQQSNLSVYNLSNPSKPDIQNTFPIPGYQSLYPGNVGVLYALGANRLAVIDVGDSAKMRILAEYDLPFQPLNLVIMDQYLVVTTTDQGLWVIERPNNGNLNIVGHFFGPVNASKMVAYQDWLYVIDEDQGIWILRVIK